MKVQAGRPTVNQSHLTVPDPAILIYGLWMLISKKLNNSLRMLNKHIITPSILLLIFGPVLLAQTDGEDIVVGNYRKLNSEITKEERTLLVRLPRDYSETSNDYPVLYLLYGQNINEYLLPAITACDLLAETGSIPEMIIVGIANAERYRDYSSISDGYIENTVQFFTDELFPFINKNYRTNDYRIIVGPQAGAVFAFYVLITHPDMFNAFIIENPFVGQNRELIFSKSNSFFANNPELEKFLFISEENNNNPLYIETARKFSEMLISKKPAGFKFSFKITEPSNYFVPPVPVKEALLKLFEPFAFPDSLKVENLNDIKEFYDNVSRIYNIPFKAPNIILTFKSDDFVNRKLFTEARPRASAGASSRSAAKVGRCSRTSSPSTARTRSSRESPGRSPRSSPSPARRSRARPRDQGSGVPVSLVPERSSSRAALARAWYLRRNASRTSSSSSSRSSSALWAPCVARMSSSSLT